MKKYIIITALAVLLMIGCPFLAVTFAGEAGMAVCFILFFAVNPLFSLVSGVYAGKNVKKLFAIPIITVALFLAGVWIFFDAGETAFLLYAAAYLVIGAASMLISASVNKKNGNT